MSIIESQLCQQLRDYAIEVRKLAYALPNGVGEYAFLQLAERMMATADKKASNGPVHPPIPPQRSIERPIPAEPDDEETAAIGDRGCSTYLALCVG